MEVQLTEVERREKNAQAVTCWVVSYSVSNGDRNIRHALNVVLALNDEIECVARLDGAGNTNAGDDGMSRGQQRGGSGEDAERMHFEGQ